MWCMAELDQEYLGRMEDVLALYEKPLSETEPVLCIDEKPVVLHAGSPPTQAHASGTSSSARLRVRTPWHGQRVLRSGAKAGRHFTKVTNDRSSPEFADYLLDVAARYPEADTIHLVMDNLSSHNRKALVDRFGEKIGGLLWERFTVHYTPKHGSWLNQAEIEISLFSRQCLGQRRIPSLGELQREARAWNRKMNRNRVTINWQFTRKKARLKFAYNRNNFTRSET